MRNMREIGSEFHIDPGNGDTDLIGLLTRCAQDMGSDIRFLRCGRDSLGFIADDITRRRSGLAGADRIIYMPALCCDSMVLPFSKRGWHIEYYMLNPDLSADTDHLCGLIDEKGAAVPTSTGSAGAAVTASRPAPVVLVMNYYGLAGTDAVRRCIRDRYPDAIIIEDVTHRVFSPAEFLSGDSRADYHIGSIRKWMGVTDGAFVTGPVDMAGEPDGVVSDFTRLRKQALLEKRDYISSADRPQTLKDHFRELFGEAEDSLEDGIQPMPMSDVAREILKNCDLFRMRDRRRENYTVLRESLATDPLCGEMYEILNPGTEVPGCPFMLPVVMDIDHIREIAHTAAGCSITRDRFENKLAARGVYAPVLWPIDAQAAEVCEVSRRFAQNMLAFYIDQRYDADDMRYVAEVFGDELRAILG